MPTISDQWEYDSHYNAIMQGLIAQGMPVESARLQVARMKQQDGGPPPSTLDYLITIGRAIGTLFIVGWVLILLYGVLLQVTGQSH